MFQPRIDCRLPRHRSTTDDQSKNTDSGRPEHSFRLVSTVCSLRMHYFDTTPISWLRHRRTSLRPSLAVNRFWKYNSAGRSTRESQEKFHLLLSECFGSRGSVTYWRSQGVQVNHRGQNTKQIAQFADLDAAVTHILHRKCTTICDFQTKILKRILGRGLVPPQIPPLQHRKRENEATLTSASREAKILATSTLARTPLGAYHHFSATVVVGILIPQEHFDTLGTFLNFLFCLNIFIQKTF